MPLHQVSSFMEVSSPCLTLNKEPNHGISLGPLPSHPHQQRATQKLATRSKDAPRPIKPSLSSSTEDSVQHSGVPNGRAPDRKRRSSEKPQINGESRRVELAEMDRTAIVSLLQQDDLGLDQGICIHAHLTERGLELRTFLANVLLSMYGRHGSFDDVRALFERMPNRSVVSWNAMITICSEHGLSYEALQLFWDMQKHHEEEPNQVTLLCALTACTNLADGKAIHAYMSDHIADPDVSLGNALINMYGKCGAVNEACVVFDNLPVRNVVSWNSMLSVHSGNGNSKKAVGLFWQMHKKGVQPDAITFIVVIGACSNPAALSSGISIHVHIIGIGLESNIVVGNALISMYGKCQALADAYAVFGRLPRKNLVTWNALIAVYAEQGKGSQALQLFHDMKQMGMSPNEITFLSMVGACVEPDSLDVGKIIHKEILSSEFKSVTSIHNALINMYGKCGALNNARVVFDNMENRNVISWSAIVTAYSENGQSKEAVQLFEQMSKAGVRPNEVTFLCLLSACTHAGFVEEGHFFFTSMVDKYGLKPTLKHYNCMVDLLGRAGQLEKAEEMIRKMPLQPDPLIWMTLLGACRIHKDMDRGKRVAEDLIYLFPHSMSTYVQLSNIYAQEGRWDDVEKVRKTMVERRAKRLLGCSWIKVEDQVHEFLLGDQSHPKIKEIGAELERITLKMAASGFSNDKAPVQEDLGHELKEHHHCGHSEKLAIAFGLISTPPEAPLQINKNLRMCNDCHANVKYISKVVGREITVQDPCWLHHFQHGECSCGD